MTVFYIRTISDGSLALLLCRSTARQPRDAAFQNRRPRPSIWHFSGSAHMGRPREGGGGAIYAVALAGRCVPAVRKYRHSQCHLLFAGRRHHGYFTDTREECRAVMALTSLIDPASAVHRRSRHRASFYIHRGDRRHGPPTARWSMPRRRDLERPLGRQLRRCLFSGRCSSAFSACAGEAQASCPVFVGADFGRLLVTSAYQEEWMTARRRSDHGRTFLLSVWAKGPA